MKDSFRAAMGRFAAGVTVITMASGDDVNAMTATAVSSVSLEPPLLLVCVDRDNHSNKVISDGGAFTVNILAEDQQELSDTFARPGAGKAEALATIGSSRGPSGSPVIDGCLAYLDCELFASHRAGDHTIFIGKVLKADVSDTDKKPLLYWNGSYAKISG